MWLRRMRLLVLRQVRCVAPVARDLTLHTIEHGERVVVERNHAADPRIAREALAHLAQATCRIVRRRVRCEETDTEIAAALAYLRPQAVAQREHAGEHVVRACKCRRVGTRS